MNADEKVKANLFGLGGHKDVSSEMFGQQVSPRKVEDKDKEDSSVYATEEVKPFTKKNGQIIIKSITSSHGGVTIFDGDKQDKESRPGKGNHAPVRRPINFRQKYPYYQKKEAKETPPKKGKKKGKHDSRAPF